MDPNTTSSSIPYLVHPAAHALFQTSQSWITSQSPSHHNPATDPQQSNSYINKLYDLILRRKLRYKRMHLIKHRGRYLNVWDVNIDT